MSGPVHTPILQYKDYGAVLCTFAERKQIDMLINNQSTKEGWPNHSLTSISNLRCQDIKACKCASSQHGPMH